MCFRFFYSLQKSWCFRKQLKRYLQDQSLQIAHMQDISRTDLDDRGIKALVLDYDGVLAAHGEASPRPEVMQYLSLYFKNSATLPIYILSNKPTSVRQEFFKKNFPEIIFIKAKRKKPYPDGLQQILMASNLQPRQILLVDDRLCTGVLATAIVGTQAFLVTDPYINLKSRPITETWFIFLRWIEKKLINSIT